MHYTINDGSFFTNGFIDIENNFYKQNTIYYQKNYYSISTSTPNVSLSTTTVAQCTYTAHLPLVLTTVQDIQSHQNLLLYKASSLFQLIKLSYW